MTEVSTGERERQLAALTPLWQRIAAGEVDLSQYSNEEIATGRIMMADGRLLPAPYTFPDIFIREQISRGLRIAEAKIREGALKALDVRADIQEDEDLSPAIRMKAGEFFLEHFLGRAEQQVTVHHTGDVQVDARTRLTERLLRARSGLPSAVQVQLAQGDVVDAEVVSDRAVYALEDLL